MDAPDHDKLRRHDPLRDNDPLRGGNPLRDQEAAEQDLLLHPPGTTEWEKQSKENSGWTRLTLGFAIAIICIFVCAGVWNGLGDAGEAASRVRCMQQGFDRIATAIDRYAEEHGAYPPPYVANEDGRRVHSWRALILPYLDATLAEEYRFDEPWDSPHNTKLHHRMPEAFHCPSDSNAPQGTTNYFAVVGEETMWPTSGVRKPADITDGRGNTILIVESTGLDILWLEPRDLEFDHLDFSINSTKGPSISSRHPGSAVVGMVDRGTRLLQTDTAPDLVRGLLTVSGGERVGDSARP